MHERHCTYVRQLRQRLAQLAKRPDVQRRILKHARLILLFALLDLEPARPLIEACYATLSRDDIGGQGAKDPIVMLRALILMSLMGYTSPHVLVSELEDHPELAVLCGFDPEPVEGEETLTLPAPSTVYDFPKRLLDGPYQPRCDHIVRPTDRLGGTHGRYLRQLAQERADVKEQTQAEMAEQSETMTQMRVRQALSRLDDQLPADFAARLNTILMLVAVAPSASAGLLGQRDTLHVVGDGSALASHANGRGHRACVCEADRCDCPRHYADPEAQWGWDSHHERYVFGDRVHLMAVHHGGRDLPLHLTVHGANAADVVIGVEAVERLYKQMREHLPWVSIASAAFDAGYDATAFYRLLCELNAAPLIPLAQAAKAVHNDGNVEFDDDATPLCPGSARMRRHQYNKKTEQILYYCPAKQRGRDRLVDMSYCPLGVLCEPESAMGPSVYVATEANRRLHLPIARDSERFKALYAHRSGAERLFSQFKAKGLDGCSRRRYLRQMRLVAHAIAMHARAWVDERFPTLPDTVEGLLAALDAIAEEGEAQQEARAAVLADKVA